MATYYTDEELNEEEEQEQFIEKHLPHGSGINCAWTVDKTANFIYFRNSYHAMSDNGFYDGYQNFSVKIPLDIWETGTNIGIALNFELQFNGDRWMAEKYDLRDYLTDTLCHAIRYQDKLMQQHLNNTK